MPLSLKRFEDEIGTVPDGYFHRNSNFGWTALEALIRGKIILGGSFPSQSTPWEVSIALSDNSQLRIYTEADVDVWVGYFKEKRPEAIPQR
jgi:hypothetical protein